MSAVLARQSLTERLLEEAEDAIAFDDLSRAKDCYRRVLAIDPEHPIANLALKEFARGEELTIDAEVSLACEPTEDLLPTEVYVLAQLAKGPTKISTIVASGRVPEPAVLLVLRRFVSRGVVAVE